MDPLTVNLLPHEERNEYRLEIIRRTLVFSGIVLALVLLAFSILLGGIFLDLKTRTSYLEEEYNEYIESSEGRRASEVQKTIRALNVKIRRVEAISKDSSDTVALLARITEHVSSGITIKEITVDVTSHSVNLSGFSTTRENLEAFRDSLAKSQGISEVNLPTASLLKRTDIDFSLSFKFL